MTKRAALMAFTATTLVASSAWACAPFGNDAIGVVVVAGLCLLFSPYLVANGIALAVMGPRFLRTGWLGIGAWTLVSSIPVALGMLTAITIMGVLSDLGLDATSRLDGAVFFSTPAVFSTAYLAGLWIRARRTWSSDDLS